MPGKSPRPPDILRKGGAHQKPSRRDLREQELEREELESETDESERLDDKEK